MNLPPPTTMSMQVDAHSKVMRAQEISAEKTMEEVSPHLCSTAQPMAGGMRLVWSASCASLQFGSALSPLVCMPQLERARAEAAEWKELYEALKAQTEAQCLHRICLISPTHLSFFQLTIHVIKLNVVKLAVCRTAHERWQRSLACIFYLPVASCEHCEVARSSIGNS